MELKEYIKETLTQIIDGVIESQKEMKDRGALIAPEGYVFKGKGSFGDLTCVESVDFEVAVEVKEGMNAKGGLKTSVIEVFVGKSDDKGNSNKVSFSIPVVYPRMKTKDFKSF